MKNGNKVNNASFKLKTHWDKKQFCLNLTILKINAEVVIVLRLQ